MGATREGANSIELDQVILEAALDNNAILITDDGNMKAGAEARKIFRLSTS